MSDMKGLIDRVLDFWYDDIRRDKTLRVTGLVVRSVTTLAIMIMLWMWLNIPGETEHQIYLILSLVFLAAALTVVNIMWYRNK